MNRGTAFIWRVAPWGIAIVLGLATLAAAVLGARYDERERVADGKALAQSAAGALEASLGGTVQRTETVAGLYDSSETVTQSEFVRFAAPLLETSGASGVIWLEHVTDDQRRAFEARLGSPIMRRGPDARFTRQSRQPVYDVITRLVTREPTRSTVGLDARGIAGRVSTLQAAEGSRSPRSTSIVTLAGSGKPGIVVYAPVFNRATSDLRGFASGSYQLERLNADVRAALPSGAGVEITQEEKVGLRSGDLTDAVQRSVVVGGRVWKVAVAGREGQWLGYGLAALLIGVPFSLLIGLTVLHLARRTRETQAIAAARTAERDIAQRGRLESETRLNTAFEEAPIGMAMLSLDGRFARVNLALAQITGHPAERLLELGLAGIVPADHQEEMGATFVAGRADDFEPFTVEHPITHASGEVRWVAVHVARLGEPGDEMLLLAQVLDITDQRLTERELRRSSRYFELSRDLICTSGFDGYFKQLNAAWTDTLGWSEDELRSHPWLDRVHPDDRERTEGETAKLTTAGARVAFVNRYATKEGGWCWIDWNASVAPDEDLIYASARDVTERMRAESALEASEGQTRQILETAHDAFVSIDGDDHITDWNRRAEVIFGWTREEALGRTLSETIVPDRLRDAHRRGLARFVATGAGTVNGQLRELVGQHRDGREFPVEFTIAPTGGAGDYSFHAFLRDVSDRNRIQAALAVAHTQAIESSRLKSEFVANMSHEIRTPLNGMIGMTELLMQTELDADQAGFAEAASRSGEALLGLVNNILDFSKIEAGKLELDHQDFDLHEMIEDACEMLAPAARDKGFELVDWIDGDVPVVVRGDRGRLRQVLTNLLANAVKFTEAGEVSVRVLALEQREGETVIAIEVGDTGVGIEAGRVEHLFESFTQADASTTRRFGGTGLGLAICRQLVGLMNGRIDVDSTLGQGSRFRVTVALDAPVGAPVVRTRQIPEGLRVLVVDDAENNRRIIEAYLTGSGGRCTLASSADEALAIMSTAAEAGAPFELVIIDYHMPGGDGLRLAADIRREPPLRATRMVMLTSVGDHHAAAREAGIRHCLTKPVRRQRLLAAAAEALAATAIGDPAPQEALGVEEALPVRAARVLLAEDNPVNRLVAAGMLGRWEGLTVTVAENGREAIEQLDRASFDLVFMDCQMPELDGYDATREIRGRPGDDARLPVIAMTANAMKGDRERCLEAGMDDYLAKPLRMTELDAVLQRWLPGESAPLTPSASPAPVTTSSAGPLVDPERVVDLHTQYDGLAAELIDLFEQTTPSLIEELRASLLAEDPDATKRAAHKLRGSCLNLGAILMARTCEALEHDEPGTDLERLIDRLETSLSHTVYALRAATAPTAG